MSGPKQGIIRGVTEVGAAATLLNPVAGIATAAGLAGSSIHNSRVERTQELDAQAASDAASATAQSAQDRLTIERTKRQAFVDNLKDNPGRNATILTPLDSRKNSVL
jgi:hypothetical protein